MFQIGVGGKIFACLRSVLSPLFHWNRFSFVAAAISFPGKQNHCACPSSLFSPGWNSVSITWDFFRFSGPFGRAENPSPVWKTGLGFLARVELRPGLNPSPCRDEISARLVMVMMHWYLTLRGFPRNIPTELHVTDYSLCYDRVIID